MAILESNQDFVDQITLADADTGYPGSAGVTSDEGFLVTAHPDNSGVVWVYENRAGKTKANGYPLAAGVHVVLSVTRLSQVKFESATAAQKVCWIKL
jgi:hypothetical protein